MKKKNPEPKFSEAVTARDLDAVKVKSRSDPQPSNPSLSARDLRSDLTFLISFLLHG